MEAKCRPRILKGVESPLVVFPCLLLVAETLPARWIYHFLSLPAINIFNGGIKCCISQSQWVLGSVGSGETKPTDRKHVMEIGHLVTSRKERGHRKGSVRSIDQCITRYTSVSNTPLWLNSSNQTPPSNFQSSIFNPPVD